MSLPDGYYEAEGLRRLKHYLRGSDSYRAEGFSSYKAGKYAFSEGRARYSPPREYHGY